MHVISSRVPTRSRIPARNIRFDPARDKRATMRGIPRGPANTEIAVVSEIRSSRVRAQGAFRRAQYRCYHYHRKVSIRLGA